MGWEVGDGVAADSQAAIRRIQNLQWETARGWIEDRVVRAAEGGKGIS